MPTTRTPQPPNAEPQVDTTRPQSPDDPDHAAKLPHERDQSVDMTHGAPSGKVQQGYRDLRRGLVDTDARDPQGRPLGQQRPTGGGSDPDKR